MIDREAFLAERAQGLGASDSPAILGLSPWAGPLSVYMSKVEPELEAARETSLPMWLGLQLQRTVGELFMTRTGKKARASHIQNKHPVWPFIQCHLDYWIIGEPAVLEIKTTRSTDGWGEEGSEDIPPHVWVQVQHQLAVTGREYGYVATLFGHTDFRWYHVPRDEDFIRRLCAALVEFWELHVLLRNPPPIDGSADATRLIRRRYPEDREPIVPATPEQAALAGELIAIRRQLKQVEKRDAELSNRVMDAIGTHGGWTGGDWSITWRKGKPRHHVEWREVVKDLEPYVPDGEYTNTIAKHTDEKEGTRPFLVKYPEE